MDKSILTGPKSSVEQRSSGQPQRVRTGLASDGPYDRCDYSHSVAQRG